MKKQFAILTLTIFSFVGFSQGLPKDTIIGKVKRIREKVIFLTEMQNPQLLYYNDYGHSGFMGPESTMAIFYNTWYESQLCYYLNYERLFDQHGRIVKDNWFGKEDDFLKAFLYRYNEKGKIMTKIDSTEYSLHTEIHYYEEYDEIVNETILSQDEDHDYFHHTFKKYKSGKLVRTKTIDEYGTINEFINGYNEKGKLSYRVRKSPDSWRKLETGGGSFGVQDSTGVVYKNLKNEYDANGNLVTSINFDLDDDNYSNEVIEVSRTTNIYENNRLIKSTKKNKQGNSYSFNYRYDKMGRLIAKYCCSENVMDAKRSQNYVYTNNLITKLDYSEVGFEDEKLKKYKILYTYKFDNLGNWNEIVKSVDGIKRYKWTREIEYY
jgi:hypothetical protein